MLLQKLGIFSSFLLGEMLSNETATSQTNFGLYNIGSEMLWGRATAIWSIKFLSKTPCRTLCDVNYFILIWSFRVSICLFDIFSNSKYHKNTICSRGYYQFSDLFNAAVIWGRFLLQYSFRCNSCKFNGFRCGYY